MTQISYADPLMERCLSHRACGETLQCISIPINPIANVAGPQGTFFVKEQTVEQMPVQKDAWIVGIWLLSMHEMETFTNVCVQPMYRSLGANLDPKNKFDVLTIERKICESPHVYEILKGLFMQFPMFEDSHCAYFSETSHSYINSGTQTDINNLVQGKVG